MSRCVRAGHNRIVMAYRCVARNQDAFVQQIVRYSNAGYRFYVFGDVKGGRNGEEIDARLIEKFSIDKSAQARSRAKKRGEANLQYLRHGKFWVILATEGRHKFFDTHRRKSGEKEWYDLRRKALNVGPYAISSKLDGGWCRGEKKLKRYRTRVTLTRAEYKELVAFFEEKAAHWSREALEERFQQLGKKYMAYRPVREQLVQLVRRTNKRRKLAGYEKVQYSSLQIPSCVRSIEVFVDGVES